jgi:shikimate kinase
MAAGKAEPRVDVAQALLLTDDRNLVLIGCRACGKTAVGKALALELARPFIDLDEVLVAQAGRSIAQIVAEEGWPGFRKREKDLVQHYARLAGQVLAPGGGVVLDPDNVEILREHGLVIWLTADPTTLSQRLGSDPGTGAFRPSLTGADPTAEIAPVLAERDHLYRAAAHLILDTTGLAVDQVVERILAEVGNSCFML